MANIFIFEYQKHFLFSQVKLNNIKDFNDCFAVEMKDQMIFMIKFYPESKLI